ncbi:hypothetical protein BXZ70DRAFT_933406 [Cristinia sonorae]|uniref:Uncharacterized protein n=1 Tax=Cristinia sonorae TaxID=1940300 RepID=A0A8K0US84_9AGAR|nr:hypothetical protein BXZ70DRAFT_933406 [Cristinia sonorae]
MAQNFKTFTIYTSTANPRKSLKHPTQIVLTVTPRKQSELFVSQTPLVWKVLEFTAQSDTQHTVVWHEDPAFAVTGRGEQSTHVSVGNSGVLVNVGPSVVWNTAQGRRGIVMARNETRMPQTFSLGAVDEDDVYEGFVRFVSTPYAVSLYFGLPHFMVE